MAKLLNISKLQSKWRQRDERLGRAAKQGAQVFTASALSELMK